MNVLVSTIDDRPQLDIVRIWYLFVSFPSEGIIDENWYSPRPLDYLLNPNVEYALVSNIKSSLLQFRAAMRA